MGSPRSTIASTSSTSALIHPHPTPSEDDDAMAIFSTSSERPAAPVADKTHTEFSEDLERRASNPKSDNGRIERVELTAEEVCEACCS